MRPNLRARKYSPLVYTQRAFHSKKPQQPALDPKSAEKEGFFLTKMVDFCLDDAIIYTLHKATLTHKETQHGTNKHHHR